MDKIYVFFKLIFNFFIFIFIQKPSSFNLNNDVDNIINTTNISNNDKLVKFIVEGDKISRSGLSLSERKNAIKVVSSNLDKIKSLRNSSDDIEITDKLINDFIKNLESNPLHKDFTPVVEHIENSTFFIFIYFIIGLYILLYLLYFIYILYRFFFFKK